MKHLGISWAIDIAFLVTCAVAGACIGLVLARIL